MSDKLISVKEAAVRLSCSEASIWKWIQDKRLQKVKIGRLTRLKEQDVDAVIRLGLQPKSGLSPEAGGQ
ncbi:MAG: helix-turn-helix domain-containing protein [Nitrospira sp.]